MLSRIPVARNDAISDEPPYETNGNGIPVMGEMPIVMPMLTNPWNANIETMPAASKVPKWSFAIIEMRTPRQTKNPNITTKMQDPPERDDAEHHHHDEEPHPRPRDEEHASEDREHHQQCAEVGLQIDEERRHRDEHDALEGVDRARRSLPLGHHGCERDD